MIVDVPGVYQEMQQDRPWGFDAVIVVAYFPKVKTQGFNRGGTTDVISCAHRYSPERGWEFGQGFFDSKCLRPHPEADRIWAEYCAAVLVNDGGK